MNPPNHPATLRDGDRDLLVRLAREVMSAAAERVTDGHHLYSPERARAGAAIVLRLVPLRDVVGWEDGQLEECELPDDLVVDCLPLLLHEKQSEWRRIADAMAQANEAGDFLGVLVSRHSLPSVSGDIDDLIGICVKLREAGYEVPAGLCHENELVA
jgi:hypothetical protein